MLQNITELTPLLDRLAPLLEKNGGFGLMQDNAEFRGRLKMLTPAFDYTFSKATLADHKTFFYNLLYIAQQDLSLAHCIQHNQKTRVAVDLGPDSAIKRRLENEKLSDTICAYSALRVTDTIKYDVDNNQLLPGTKCWLSNLKSADIVAIEVLPVGATSYSVAHSIHKPGKAPDIYMVYIDLSQVKHSITDGNQSPTAVGMKGAAPGTLTLLDPVTVDTDACYVIRKNPSGDLTYTWIRYAWACWVTVHLGVIMGLYNELRKYPETNTPEIKHKLKEFELEISQLKIMWEHSLEHMTDSGDQTSNPILPLSTGVSIRSTQYASSKRVLLDLIRFVLEIGLNQFVDDTGPTWIRFKDAITYSTHMSSLYRCHNRWDNYNNFNTSA